MNILEIFYELEKSEEVIGISDGTNCWCGQCGSSVISGNIDVSYKEDEVIPIGSVDTQYPLENIKKHFEIKCFNCGRIYHKDFLIQEIQWNNKTYTIYRRTDLVYGIEVDRPEDELIKNLDDMYKVVYNTRIKRMSPPILLYMEQIGKLKAAGYRIWRNEGWPLMPMGSIHKIKKAGDIDETQGN